jgi:hypothetical protein
MGWMRGWREVIRSARVDDVLGSCIMCLWWYMLSSYFWSGRGIHTVRMEFLSGQCGGEALHDAGLMTN